MNYWKTKILFTFPYCNAQIFEYSILTLIQTSGISAWLSPKLHVFSRFISWKHLFIPWPLPKNYFSLDFGISNFTNYIKLRQARVHWKINFTKIQPKKIYCCEQKINRKYVSSWKQRIYCNYLAIWKALWKFTESIIAVVVYLRRHTRSKMELFMTLGNSFQTLSQWTPSSMF